MITCERCGKQIADSAAICPSCGTVSSISRPGSAPYAQNPPSSLSYEYSQGYSQQSVYAQETDSAPQSAYPPQASYPPSPAYPQQTAYPAQPVYVPPVVYPPLAVNINVVTPVVAPVVSTPTSTNNGALIAEVLLNIFLGIYGVGWLMAGETTTGIILLVCSLVLYWPSVILGTIFTVGLGLACIAPLSIGAIILNTVLLNNVLKRKALYVILPNAPVRSFPPQ
ncbi:MAG TPA: zinc ribbon domain-containing protein [Ktedonobacteraceae bacterium]